MIYEAELFKAARSRIGKPFRHHFKPDNNCQFGTLPLGECMKFGMDDTGYDCSGLVVASICDVLGIKPTNWPVAYRHRSQILKLETFTELEAGDIAIFHGSQHMGIYVAPDRYIHANGRTKAVEEGAVLEDTLAKIGRIPLKEYIAIPNP